MDTPKLNEIKSQLTLVLNQINKYEEKPTKAESARIRKSLSTIKNNVTAVRAELIAVDKV